jgi:hypothetical protein
MGQKKYGTSRQSNFSVRLTQEERQRVIDLAASRLMSQSDFIVWLINQVFEKNERRVYAKNKNKKVDLERSSTQKTITTF